MYTTENKPAKRFDYNTYIQGRLAGKYVIAYIDEDIQEQPFTQDVIDDVEPTEGDINKLMPFTDKKVAESIDVTNDVFEGYPELNIICEAGLIINCDVFLLKNILFHYMPKINCRGAPVP